MRERIKSIIPKIFRYHLKNNFRRLKTFNARRSFEKADYKPAWLDGQALKSLQARYPNPPEIRYEPEFREKDGDRSAGNILKVLGRAAHHHDYFLELGSAEGFACLGLSRRKKKAVGVDIRSVLKKSIVDGNVSLLQMDAARLGFHDASFDVVFSMAAFEHFHNPEEVLKEAIRVVKPGGFLYLHFGPLYMSPYGLHAYRSITVPYCHFLFPKETLIDFCVENKLAPPDFTSVNMWSLEDYRKLWENHSVYLKPIRYYEYINVDYVDLIERYPSCFRSKTEYFDNLIVPEIEALFQKI